MSGFGKRQRKCGGGRHADQDTAEPRAMAALMTRPAFFAIRRRMENNVNKIVFRVRLVVAAAAAVGAGSGRDLALARPRYLGGGAGIGRQRGGRFGQCGRASMFRSASISATAGDKISMPSPGTTE